MKKLLGLSLAAAIALTSQVNAKDGKYEVSGSAALTSNYIWRGISYTNTTPTAQMGIDLDNVFNAEGFHINLWGSGIQEGSEIDTIIGYKFKAGSAEIDIAAINYYYTQDYRGDLGGTTDGGTFAGASYAEAYIDVQFEHFGLGVYSEIGYAESNTDTYDGLTVIANASFADIELTYGTRMTDKAGAEDSKFGSIAYSWDCKLMPSWTASVMVAFNDQFKTYQGDQTAAFTLSKDF